MPTISMCHVPGMMDANESARDISKKFVINVPFLLCYVELRIINRVMFLR